MHKTNPQYRITPQVIALYNALMHRGIKCKIEDDSDGHKTVDISIPEAKINIEVDGLQHFTDPKQIKSDFKRSYWSYYKDYISTFHIPNSIVENYLNEVADALTVVAKENQHFLEKEYSKLSYKIVLKIAKFLHIKY